MAYCAPSQAGPGNDINAGSPGSQKAPTQSPASLVQPVARAPLVTRGVLNDAISLYFADATLASAFVARWCVGSKVETAGGVFQVREDEPAPRVGARLHRTP
jgi:hypothetical protein